jgi:sugar phosphate isomerase/epimerase
MRFGIMAMQLGALIPPSQGGSGAGEASSLLAHVANFSHAALVRSLHGHGFNPIELGGDLVLFMPHVFAPQAIEELAGLKAETGVTYTVHLPLWSVETSTPLAPVRRGSVQAVMEIIRAVKPLEPEVYVLHATGALAAEFYRMRLPAHGKALILRQFQAGARESLRTILGETGLPPRRLAIETVEFPFDLTLELAEEFDLSLCLDTGHVLVGFSGPVDLFSALERCLPRLAEIHLHDAPCLTTPALWRGPEEQSGYGKDHAPLGTGDLDLARLLDRLVEAHFMGPVILELKVHEALASLEVIRRVRPQVLL